MIHRLDAWIGLRLFHPPIIWLCQRTGMTQWAFYRYLWWVFALWAVWRDPRDSVIGTVWIVGFALLRTLNAGLALNTPVRSSLLVRGIIYALLAIILIPPISQRDIEGALMQLVILTAEYAATISTIPPRRQRERMASSREAWASPA